MNQYCTFCVDDMVFGVDVNRVQEVVRHQRMTRVPLAPSEVRGLINLRGQIVTAVDLRRKLRLPAHAKGDSSMNVMIHTPDGIVSLIVDQIDDVVEIDPTTLEEPPPTLRTEARALITAAAKQEKRLVLLLDVDQALNLSTLNELNAG